MLPSHPYALSVKGFLPREGKMKHETYSSGFMNDEVNDVLTMLRKRAGMPGDGPATDIEVWLEGGPNHAPTFTPLHLDFTVETIAELGLVFGDVLVV